MLGPSAVLLGMKFMLGGCCPSSILPTMWSGGSTPGGRWWVWSAGGRGLPASSAFFGGRGGVKPEGGGVARGGVADESGGWGDLCLGKKREERE